MHAMLKKSWPGIVAVLLAVLLAPRVASADVYAYDDYQSTHFATPKLIFVSVSSDGDPIDWESLEILSPPNIGTVEIVEPFNGSVIYTPNSVSTAYGPDSFTFDIADTSGLYSNEATVYIDVGQPFPPLAINDSLETGFQQAGTVDVLANDVEIEGPLVPLTVDITAFPSYGTVQNNYDGTVLYTPSDTSDDQDDQFSYTVEDVYGNVSLTGTVYVHVAKNEPPTLVFDEPVLAYGNTWTISGHVSDDQSVAGRLVELGGYVNSQTATDAFGDFSIDLEILDPFAEVIGTAYDIAEKESDSVSLYFN